MRWERGTIGEHDNAARSSGRSARSLAEERSLALREAESHEADGGDSSRCETEQLRESPTVTSGDYSRHERRRETTRAANLEKALVVSSDLGNSPGAIQQSSSDLPLNALV